MKNINNNNIHIAIQLYYDDTELAIYEYGLINKWDMSKVTNMDNLFKYKQFFNDLNQTLEKK